MATSYADVVAGNNPVEYVEEATFATTPTNPAMGWMGLVESFTPTVRSVVKDTRYMAASGDDALEAVLQTKTGQELELAARILPQSLTFWATYVLGGTGGTADTMNSISIGHVLDSITTAAYGMYRGCVAKSAQLTFARDAPATLEISWLAADFDGYSGTDYIGTGSHASASTDAPLLWSDLSALTWGGAVLDPYVQELVISVENQLKPVYDVGATTSTGISTILPVKRDIKVSLTLDLDDADFYDSVRNLTEQDLVATIDSTDYTIAGVAFPELAAEYKGDDAIEQTIESVPCKSIAIA
ncbi:MAG: phage tail tube protein [Methermicoccaceae archaeon]